MIGECHSTDQGLILLASAGHGDALGDNGSPQDHLNTYWAEMSLQKVDPSLDLRMPLEDAYREVLELFGR